MKLTIERPGVYYAREGTTQPHKIKEEFGLSELNIESDSGEVVCTLAQLVEAVLRMQFLPLTEIKDRDAKKEVLAKYAGESDE